MLHRMRGAGLKDRQPWIAGDFRGLYFSKIAGRQGRTGGHNLGVPGALPGPATFKKKTSDVAVRVPRILLSPNEFGSDVLESKSILHQGRCWLPRQVS